LLRPRKGERPKCDRKVVLRERDDVVETSAATVKHCPVLQQNHYHGRPMMLRIPQMPKASVPLMSGPDSNLQNTLKVETANTDRIHPNQSQTKPLPRVLDQRGRPQGCLCQVCRSPNALAINMALLTGEPLRSIEERTGHSKSSLQRHQSHIPPLLVAAANSQKAADAATVVSGFCELLESVRGVRIQAYNDGDMRAFFLAAAREQALMAIQAKISESEKPPQVKFTETPEYKKLRQLILKITKDHPQVRIGLAAALKEFENDNP
jgi:hypothetical protein